MDEENEFSLSIPAGLLHAVKCYDMGLSALPSIREESVMQLFIALKISLLWPG
jgi:hypothetical protein